MKFFAEKVLSFGECRECIRFGLQCLRVGPDTWMLRTRWNAHIPHWDASFGDEYYQTIEDALQAMMDELR